MENLVYLDDLDHLGAGARERLSAEYDVCFSQGDSELILKLIKATQQDALLKSKAGELEELRVTAEEQLNEEYCAYFSHTEAALILELISAVKRS